MEPDKNPQLPDEIPLPEWQPRERLLPWKSIQKELGKKIAPEKEEWSEMSKGYRHAVSHVVRRRRENKESLEAEKNQRRSEKRKEYADQVSSLLQTYLVRSELACRSEKREALEVILKRETGEIQRIDRALDELGEPPSFDQKDVKRWKEYARLTGDMRTHAVWELILQMLLTHEAITWESFSAEAQDNEHLRGSSDVDLVEKFVRASRMLVYNTRLVEIEGIDDDTIRRVATEDSRKQENLDTLLVHTFGPVDRKEKSLQLERDGYVASAEKWRLQIETTEEKTKKTELLENLAGDKVRIMMIDLLLEKKLTFQTFLATARTDNECYVFDSRVFEFEYSYYVEFLLRHHPPLITALPPSV